MRSITFVQAFQYWLKLTALLVPAIFLVLAWQAHGAPADRLRPTRRPSASDHVRVDLTAPTWSSTERPLRRHRDRHRRRPPVRRTPRVGLAAGGHRVEGGTRLSSAPDRRCRRPTRDASDGMSISPAAGSEQHPLYATYGLIVATFLGTMGLPHVVVRFYTSPNGRAARRTTVAVLALIGAFYLLPPRLRRAGPAVRPRAALTGDTDAAVLLLPDRMIGGTGGDLLGALVAGGAFAAFLSTASGTDHGGRGRAHPGRAAVARGTRTSGSATSWRWPYRWSRSAAGGRAAGGRRGGDGVRGVGVLLLPAAGARHLVAAADPAGGGRRGCWSAAARRWPRSRVDHRRPAARRLAARAARLAGGVVGAGGLPHDGPGVAGHPGQRPARHRRHHGPVPPAGSAWTATAGIRTGHRPGGAVLPPGRHAAAGGSACCSAGATARGGPEARRRPAAPPSSTPPSRRCTPPRSPRRRCAPGSPRRPRARPPAGCARCSAPTRCASPTGRRCWPGTARGDHHRDAR